MPTNLPTALTTFVGRADEIRELAAVIERGRLTTLTGAGGCGKTRLALQVAARTLQAFPGGVWLVELAPVATGEDVPRAVANTLGLREEPDRELLDTLTRHLRDRHILLVLDNCEHVLAGCIQLAARLLPAIRGLHLLTTSREALGVDGEFSWRVPSLDVETGVGLFLDRARLVSPRDEPDSTALAAIRGIVERLDGLPLAIELAAARLRMMQAPEILASLDDRFRLLTGGNRGALPRQQTLEASVAWSYDLLTAGERRLARRLAVLRSFDLDAAEAIDDASSSEGRVLDPLTRLVDQSFLLAEPAGAGTRYRFLETIRQFLLARLLRSDEARLIRDRHLAYFLATAERLAPSLALGEGPVNLERLERDHANLDGALWWAQAAGNGTAALRMTTALTLFYELRGHLGHGRRWFDRALSMASATEVDGAIRARALWGAAHVSFYGGHYADAGRLAVDSLSAARDMGDTWAEARALNTLGVLQSLSTPEEARTNLERSIALGATAGDDWAIADGWKMVTVAWYTQHDERGARTALETLRHLASRLESRFFLAWAEAMEGYFARDRGDLATAATSLDRALSCCRDIGEPSTGGFAECWASALAANRGDSTAARERLQALLARATTSGSELAVPEAVYALALIEIGRGQPRDAVALLAPHVEPLCAMHVPGWAGQVLLALAAAERHLGHHDAANAALLRASTQLASLGNAYLDALLAFERGALAAVTSPGSGLAEDRWHTALAAQMRQGVLPAAIRTLEALSGAAATTESDAEAVRLAASTTGARERMGLARTAVELAAYEALAVSLTERLGDEAFRTCWKEGYALSLADSAAYAARARGERKRPSTGWDSLTPTERRVAALVAEGLTNAQIGDRLFIAAGTAKIHLAHIFTKLDITSRAQLAAMATARAAGR